MVVLGTAILSLRPVSGLGAEAAGCQWVFSDSLSTSAHELIDFSPKAIDAFDLSSAHRSASPLCLQLPHPSFSFCWLTA